MHELDPLPDDLPREALDLLSRGESLLRELEARAQSEIDHIEAKASAEMAKIRQRADEHIEAARAKREGAAREARESLVAQLKPLQDALAREGRLDEALAVRAEVRRLRMGPAQASNAMPDPGNMTQFRASVGQTLDFEVTGDLAGPVWGSGPYTADSRLATAAVHAGALKVGERGVVRATVVETGGIPLFTASLQNGVQSSPWGPYPLGYRVSKR